MRRNLASWTALVGVLSALAFSTPPALAQERTETVRAGSFAGAYLAGRIAETDNDLASAIAYYRRALSFDPDNRGLQQSLMLALISTGEFDDALAHADRLRDVPEVNRFSRLALAVDALRGQEFAAARELIAPVAQSDLDRMISGVITAWALAGEGDGEGALARLDTLKGPEWFAVFVGYHRGLIAEQAGMAEIAEEAYRSVVANVDAGSAAPDTFLRAAEAQARFLARAGRGEEAAAALEEAEGFVSGRVSLKALREAVEAGEEIAPAIASPVDGAAEILLNLATALNRGGGESFVRLYLQYALALTPDKDAVLVQLGSIAEQQRDSALAIDYYARIGQDSPLWRVAQLQLGLNLADLERHEEAIEHLEALLADDPDDMRAYLALGSVHSAQQDYRASADLYERAVARIDEPQAEHWNIFYQRGIAYERLKEWERAEPNFKQALELYPDHPQVLNYLGYSWVDMKMNLEEGLDLIKRAVELRPSDGYIVDSLGWAYYRLERYEEAVTELERAVGLMPYDPILNDHLGDAYWQVGRKLEATFQWRHARDLEPEPELLEEIEAKLRHGLRDAAEDDADDQAGLDQQGAAEASDVMVASAAPFPAPEPQDPSDDEQIAVAPEPAQPAPARTHVVQPGQSLWMIAVEVLGDGSRFGELLRLNPVLRGNPDRLFPGQELILPGPAE